MAGDIKVRHLLQTGATGFVLGAATFTRTGRGALRAIGRDLGRAGMVGGRVGLRGTKVAVRGSRFALRGAFALARAPAVVTFAAVTGAGAAISGVSRAVTAPRGTGVAGRADIGAGVFISRFVSALTFRQSKRLGSEAEVIRRLGVGRGQIANFFALGGTKRASQRREPHDHT